MSSWTLSWPLNQDCQKEEENISKFYLALKYFTITWNVFSKAKILLKLYMITFMGSYPLFSEKCCSPSDEMLFFEVTILPKFGKVSRLSLKLYLKVKIANFKNTRRSFPINISNWIPDITQFPAMLVGFSGEIAVNYLLHAVYCITSSCEEWRILIRNRQHLIQFAWNQEIKPKTLSYSAEGKSRPKH